MSIANTSCIARRLRIEGRVQGVSYRAWFTEQAKHRELDGWVRNRKDGSVEALVKGDPAQVEGIIERAWRGPLFADVTVVTVEEAQGIVPQGFARKPTI